MACTSYSFKGLETGCKDSLGGIKKIWVANFDDVAYEMEKDDQDQPLGVVKPTATAAFKVFKFRRNVSSMTSNLQVSDTAGNSFQTDVVLQFMKQETKKRIELMGLFMGETKVIVKDGNDKYWALGYDYPIEASAGDAITGTASTDLNGYDITLTDYSAELPYEITDETTITALEAIVVA